MASPAGRLKAVTFRRKVFVGENHADAVNLMFAGMTELSIGNVSDRIACGKEALVFGYAFDDGSDFVECDLQEARKAMYGFEERY